MSQVMIVVEFETKPEHRSQFIDLMRGHAERSRRDDGCLQFDLMLPKDDEKHVFLVEKWRDQEALEVTSVKLVEIGDCGSRRPDAVAPMEGCLQSVRLRAAIDGMADCAAGAAPLSSPAPDGAPLRGCGA